MAPRDGNLARIRALRFEKPGFDMGVWREIAELGWIGMALSEEQGGVGFGMGEAVALAEELDPENADIYHHRCTSGNNFNFRSQINDELASLNKVTILQ